MGSAEGDDYLNDDERESSSWSSVKKSVVIIINPSQQLSATRLTSPVRQRSKVSFASPASERHVSAMKYPHVKPKQSEE